MVGAFHITVCGYTRPSKRILLTLNNNNSVKGLKYSDYLLEQAGECSLFPNFNGHMEWCLAQVGTINQTLFLNAAMVYWGTRM